MNTLENSVPAIIRWIIRQFEGREIRILMLTIVAFAAALLIPYPPIFPLVRQWQTTVYTLILVVPMAMFGLQIAYGFLKIEDWHGVNNTLPISQRLTLSGKVFWTYTFQLVVTCIICTVVTVLCIVGYLRDGVQPDMWPFALLITVCYAAAAGTTGWGIWRMVAIQEESHMYGSFHK